MGKLFLVPTPVGNLDDMTFRAIQVLKEVDIIYAEDTRTSSVLLKKFEIGTHMESHHKFNEHTSSQRIVDKILEGRNVALITDAGTPGISDPGFLLVRTCVENDVEVSTLPGATAFVPALVNSGLACDKFVFEGFIPVKKGRQTWMKTMNEESRTMILYESPYRLLKTLTQLAEYFGETRFASVSREISKFYEETKRGTLKELVEWFTEHNPKGEIVIIIEGRDHEKKREKKE
ncbi:MAG: 16S rRNA (cytidine(1402)-2'-O)-methyltransferase [Bacteroidales bacterium]